MPKMVKMVAQDSRATWLKRIAAAKAFKFKVRDLRKFVALETLHALNDRNSVEVDRALFRVEGDMIDAAFESVVGRAEIEFSGDPSDDTHRYIIGVTDALYNRLADALMVEGKKLRTKLRKEAGL